MYMLSVVSSYTANGMVVSSMALPIPFLTTARLKSAIEKRILSACMKFQDQICIYCHAVVLI